MKTETRGSKGTRFDEDTSLVVLDVDAVHTLSISGAGIEFERFDSDGNSMAQKWLSMDELFEIMDV